MTRYTSTCRAALKQSRTILISASLLLPLTPFRLNVRAISTRSSTFVGPIAHPFPEAKDRRLSLSSVTLVRQRVTFGSCSIRRGRFGARRNFWYPESIRREWMRGRRRAKGGCIRRPTSQGEYALIQKPVCVTNRKSTYASIASSHNFILRFACSPGSCSSKAIF